MGLFLSKTKDYEVHYFVWIYSYLKLMIMRYIILYGFILI